jgi:hypothetical protein
VGKLRKRAVPECPRAKAEHLEMRAKAFLAEAPARFP